MSRQRRQERTGRTGRLQPADAQDSPPANGAARETDFDDEFENLPTRQRHGGRRSEAVERRLGRLQADSPVAPTPAEAQLGPPGIAATILALDRGLCEVELEDGRRQAAHLPKALTLAQRSGIAVGDRVLLTERPGRALAVARLLPRSSRLSRPDPFHTHRERVLAANLDLAVVVASVRNPALSTGLLDRFLVALAHGGVPALLAINKVDLVEGPRDHDPELARLRPYAELDVPVLLLSATTGEGIEALRERLTGKLTAFVGHSGVGKSSVLNALDPRAAAAVGEVSTTWQKGRHTTTRARIYTLGSDIRVIDTPGIREFGLWRLSAGELAGYFDEFAALAGACRFTDCTHVHEPGCAVLAAAQRGELPRYATYRRMLESLDDH